jgi:hypothetical protein
MAKADPCPNSAKHSRRGASKSFLLNRLQVRHSGRHSNPVYDSIKRCWRLSVGKDLHIWGGNVTSGKVKRSEWASHLPARER